MPGNSKNNVTGLVFRGMFQLNVYKKWNVSLGFGKSLL